MKQVLIFICCILCGFFGGVVGSCINGTNCDDGGCEWYELSQATFVFLEEYSGEPFDEFASNMKQAVSILEKYGTVITDDNYILHISLQYLCCYSVVQYWDIIDVLEKVPWQPINLTFTSTVCASGGDGDLSILALVDQPTQQILANFVEQLEAAMTKAGIPVRKPRSKMEPFHSTVGVVPDSFPADQALKEVNQKIPIYNSKPMTISSFWMVVPPHLFHAHN
jgi:hypothetical protein